jgi:glycosyltransferase involved in cell wall biosynthesis
LGLARALLRAGLEVSFVLPKRLGAVNSAVRVVFGDDYYRELGLDTITLHEVDSPLYPYLTSSEYEAAGRSGLKTSPYAKTLIGEVLRYAMTAAKVARDEEFDVIHAHDWLSFPAGLEAKRISGKPLIVHVHATEFDRGGGTGVNQEVYDIERKGMEGADKVIAVSHHTKDILVSRYSIPPEKISVVHNGIDEADYLVPHGTPSEIQALRAAGNKIVLFVGRITIQKGPDYFVKMARKVLEYKKDVYFVVAGSGDMEWRMVEAVAAAGMSDRFIFTGFLRGEELNEVYRAADLYVMPSVSEPFGITPLEANLNGTPVLISKQTGAGEILSHALRCDFWDTDEMANQALAVLEHRSLHDTLRENGRAETRSIDWNKAAEKCIIVYDSVA